MEILTNNGTFFKELKRKTDIEMLANKTRIPSLVNTYQNQQEFQQAENLSRNYARKGQQKFADPFAFHMKPNNFLYDGRKLQIQQTLLYNAKQDYPDVITKNRLKIVGYY